MKKFVLALIAGIMIVSALQTAVAYSYPYREYTFDLGRGDVHYRNYNYADYYGYPAYQVYEPKGYYIYGNGHYNDDYDYGRYYGRNRIDTSGYLPGYSYRDKLRTSRFLIQSYNYRYDLNSGKSSAESFCTDCVTDGSYSSFGNKPAYDPRADGVNGDYYKPTFDVNTETYNWRF